jgi:hypothetical protein
MTISKTLTHVTGMRGRNSWFLGALVTLFFVSTPAGATVINFTCVPGSVVGCIPVAAQLEVQATSSGLGTQLQLVISNPGPFPSVVSEVYFDFAGSLFSGFASSTGTGVDFPIGGPVTPPDLPGGNGVAPPFASNLGIAADNPSPANGIGIGDSLTLVLDIGAPNTIANVVAQFISGDFRIGFHIQGIGGDSASVVSNPLPVGTPRDLGDEPDGPGVPEPSTWLLMSAGVVGLIARRSFIR